MIMSREITVYKACAVVDGKYVSSFVNSKNGFSDLELVYKIGKTTEPKFGAIFALKSIDDINIIDFVKIKNIDQVVFLECKAKISKSKYIGIWHLPKLLPNGERESIESWIESVKILYSEHYKNPAYNSDTNYVYCSSITPIRVVKKYKKVFKFEEI